MASLSAVERRERVRVWLMLAVGTLAAAAEAWLVCSRLRPAAKASWVGPCFWSVLSTGICVSGGAAAAWLAGMALRMGRQASSLLMGAAAGWMFLPCIALMAGRGSWMALPVTALAATAATFRLRPVLGGREEDAEVATDASGDLRSLQGLPPTGAPPMRSFGAAVLVQLAVLLTVRGWVGPSSVVLAVCVAMLLVWSTERDGHWARMWMGRRRGLELAGTAVLLTLLLTPWAMGRGAASAGERGGNGHKLGAGTKGGSAGNDYVGIVLWPPPVKKAEIVPPRPKTLTAGVGAAAKPLVIPFDGPYWYFKAPATGPGPMAHMAFGKPTEQHVRSSNRMPLRMEAHQNLGLPIDLDCCREIDVTVTNADLGVGTIYVSLTLVDGSTSVPRSEIVGEEPVASSEVGEAGDAARTGEQRTVTETLKFPLPRAAAIRSFDAIDVVIQPTAIRARMGSRLAVDSFELEPK